MSWTSIYVKLQTFSETDCNYNYQLKKWTLPLLDRNSDSYLSNKLL